MQNYRNYPSTCLLGSTDKDDGNKAKVQIPENVASFSGKVTLKQGYYEWPPEESRRNENSKIVELYSAESEEDLHIICNDCMPRTIPSNFKNDEYRHHINSLDYRYGLGLAGRVFLSKEQQAALDFRHRINASKYVSFQFNVDALWFLNLFQASYYGGYSDEDIVNEMIAGPGVIHTQIPKSAWKSTQQYVDVTAKAELIKDRSDEAAEKYGY